MYELSLGTKKIVRLRLHIKRVSVKRGSTVYNRVRGWTLGQSIPVQNSVESPAGLTQRGLKNSGERRKSSLLSMIVSIAIRLRQLFSPFESSSGCEVACITRALWPKRGEHGILRTFRASLKMPCSPRLTHKAPFMQDSCEVLTLTLRWLFFTTHAACPLEN